MRFFRLVFGYSLRRKEKPLIMGLATVAFIPYIILTCVAAVALLALRLDVHDLPIQPGLIVDQVPQPGEEVVYGYPIGITITRAASQG